MEIATGLKLISPADFEDIFFGDDICWAFMADSGSLRGYVKKESVLFPNTYV